MESPYFTSIIHIRNKVDNTMIPKERCSIQEIISLYSNTRKPIFKLTIDNKPISRNNNYTVRYICQNCNAEREITLNLYMRKINKAIIRCDACKNNEQTKREKHREFMKQNVSNIISGTYKTQLLRIKVKQNTLDQQIDKSLIDWDNEDDNFKERYYLYHLTTEDFERIRSKIISINNDKFKNINEWNYFPAYRVYNQTRFTPMLIHKTDGCIEKPLYLKFKCDNCESEFVHRDIEIIKNHYKILCQTCSFTNKVFCIRHKTLKNGEKIMWQSIPERRFIEWCEENDIVIKNGPKIAYNFQNKNHTYKVDFELPDKKILVEIKDNHCWHKQQVASGKFQIKESAAKNWCKTNNYEYHIVFPKTLQKFKDSILNKSL